MNYAAILGACFVGFATLAFGGGPVPKGPVVPKNEAADPQAKDGQEQEAREGATFPNFKLSEFPFVVIVPDDGKGEAGGWQAARANLEFTRVSLPITMITWFCPLTVEIPIRHSTRGIITPLAAATMSAAVANSVVATMDFKLPQGIFCDTFKTRMLAAFPVMYPGLGARVTK